MVFSSLFFSVPWEHPSNAAACWRGKNLHFISTSVVSKSDEESDTGIVLFLAHIARPWPWLHMPLCPPLQGSFKTLCPLCQVSQYRPAALALFCLHLSVHRDRLLEANQENRLWTWPGVRDEWLSLLQSSWSIMTAQLWCSCHKTASGNGEKGPWSVYPVVLKHFPAHEHLQLFTEHQ